MDATTPTLSTIREVRDACLCLAAQRAARRLARRFDRAFQAAGLTNGQFSALMFLAGGGATSAAALADLLAMDRTTVIALLKALQRRGLVDSAGDPADRRRRRLTVTEAGRAALAIATPIWRAEHARLEAALPPGAAQDGRAFLGDLAALHFDASGALRNEPSTAAGPSRPPPPPPT